MLLTAHEEKMKTKYSAEAWKLLTTERGMRKSEYMRVLQTVGKCWDNACLYTVESRKMARTHTRHRIRIRTRICGKMFASEAAEITEPNYFLFRLSSFIMALHEKIHIPPPRKQAKVGFYVFLSGFYRCWYIYIIFRSQQKRLILYTWTFLRQGTTTFDFSRRVKNVIINFWAYQKSECRTISRVYLLAIPPKKKQQLQFKSRSVISRFSLVLKWIY